MRFEREIGGYLELERFGGEPYHRAEDGAIALNSGRVCLEYLIELRDIRTIWLPDWLCEAVPNVCEKHGVSVKMYAVGADMRPTYDFDVADGEWLYLVDYYGQLGEADVGEAAACSGGRLVVDEAQGFFKKPWPSADTLYTCRKFFGVADGGYLYTRDDACLDRELTQSESHMHMSHVLGRFERPAGEFFAASGGNEGRFAGEPMSAMAPVTANLLCAVDYGEVKRRREENFAFLHMKLGRHNLLDPRVVEGPFMYPFLVRDARGVRERLAQRGIYVSTLWPNVLEQVPIDSTAWRYSMSILPLPIDQRYGEQEMEIICNKLHEIGVITND